MLSTPPSQLPLTETREPATQAEMADVVREAYASGTPVYPIGGGTGIDYGVRPTRPGIGLSTARLNRIVDYPTRDLTITVESGVTMAAIDKRLRAEHQRLPVDIPRAAQATIGGVLATNPAGSRRYRWGTMRDYLLGVRAIDGRGIVFSSGGRVVKNVAGYDLGRLLSGSLGTLGVITQVTLMVRPTPQVSLLVVADLHDFQAAAQVIDRLARTEVLPTSIDLVVGPAWNEDPAFVGRQTPGLGRLLVGLEGTPIEVEWMVGQLRDQWRRLGISGPVVIDGRGQEKLLDRLTQFPVASTQTDAATSLVVRINVLPSATVDMIRLARQLDPDCSLLAHAGNGNVTVRFSSLPIDPTVGVDGRLRAAVAAVGGTMTILAHDAALELDREAVWGPPHPAMRLMSEVKERLDPKGILNPGRYIFASRPAGQADMPEPTEQTV